MRSVRFRACEIRDEDYTDGAKVYVFKSVTYDGVERMAARMVLYSSRLISMVASVIAASFSRTIVFFMGTLSTPSPKTGHRSHADISRVTVDGSSSIRSPMA